jgi:hypothetical protein
VRDTESTTMLEAANSENNMTDKNLASTKCKPDIGNVLR